MMGRNIDPTAKIATSAILGQNVSIGAHVVIHDLVILEDDVVIEANTVIGANPKTKGATRSSGNTLIGEGTYIGESVVIDAPILGDTVIGAKCYLMPLVYVGHDCHIERASILSSGVKLGGYVHLGAHCNLGFNVSVHQFSTIGAYAMVGMGAVVNKDIPPFCKVFGVPAAFRGTNAVGMRRNQFDEATIAQIDHYLKSGVLDQTEAASWLQHFDSFNLQSSRKKLTV
jgi:UDP-N-acetylglucosamine acyltransferase